MPRHVVGGRVRGDVEGLARVDQVGVRDRLVVLVVEPLPVAGVVVVALGDLGQRVAGPDPVVRVPGRRDPCGVPGLAGAADEDAVRRHRVEGGRGRGAPRRVCGRLGGVGRRDRRLGRGGDGVLCLRRRDERSGDRHDGGRLARLLRYLLHLRGGRVPSPAPDPQRQTLTAPSGHALPSVVASPGLRGCSCLSAGPCSPACQVPSHLERFIWLCSAELLDGSMAGLAGGRREIEFFL